MERTGCSRWMAGLFALAVFAFVFVFFAQVHPLVLYDGDDWATASYQRSALPKWQGWNPCRVFPEVFMPLCTSLAAHVIYPLTGDYSGAMSLIFAVAAAAFITAYVGLLRRFAKRRFSLDTPATILIAALFLALHFLCFRSQDSGNAHLFYADNTCTFFYYTLPALLNASLVLLWEAGGCFERLADPGHPVRDGLLILAVYMSVFSNLFGSQILAIYAGVRIVTDVCAQMARTGKPAKALRGAFTQHAWEWAVLLLWLIALIFEANGGRAGNLTADASYVDNLKKVYWKLPSVRWKFNNLFLTIAVLVPAAAAAVLLISRGRTEADRAFAQSAVRSVLCLALSSVYLVLLCAATKPSYIQSAQVLLGAVFYLLLLLSASAAYLIRKCPRLLALLPLALVLIVFETDTRQKTFAEPNISRIPAKTAMAVSDAMIAQMVELEKAGQTDAEALRLYVPVGDDNDNWPHPTYMLYNFTKTLCKHGILEHEYHFGTIVPTEDFDARYGIR